MKTKNIQNQKVIITRYGGPEVLKMISEDIPALKADEVLIRIQRTGVAYIDRMMRKGIFPNNIKATPGFDIVGTVVEKGNSVKSFTNGDKVAAIPGKSGYANYIVLKEKHLIKLPNNIDIDKSCSVILNYTTAHLILTRYLKAKPGNTLLMQGASGGLGTAMLQLCKLYNIKVLGTASEAKKDVVIQNGGTYLNYKHNYIDEIKKLTAGKGVDFVVDGVGGKNYSLSYKALSSKGTLVGIGYEGNSKMGFLASWLRLFSFKLNPFGKKAIMFSIVIEMNKRLPQLKKEIELLMDLLNDKKINPVIYDVVPLKEYKKAHQLLEERKIKGKLILNCE